MRGELKACRHQVRQASGRERELAGLKVRLEEERAAVQRELDQVRALLEETTQQLKREGDTRMRDVSKIQRGEKKRGWCEGEKWEGLWVWFSPIIIDLELSQSQLNQEQMEMAAQQRECSKVERENKKLREELQLLQEQVSQHSIPKAQVEAYKKEIEDKVGIFFFTLHQYMSLVT